MKLKTISTLLAGTALSLGLLHSTNAVAVPSYITDSYEGSDSHGWGDVIGSTSHFQIDGMEVSLAGSMLSISIDTTFAGKGDDHLFNQLTAGQGIGYGDLFLSNSWDPFGTAPYASDDASNGTNWTYGFSLDDRWMNEADAGTGTLYSLNSGDNSDILLAEDFLTGGTYRNGQEVAVDTTGNVTAIAGNSSWNIDAANDKVNFLIDLTGTDLLAGDEIAIHWGFTCQNDVIEGAYAVSEPSMMLLLSSSLGLLMLSSYRRNRQ